MRSKFQKPDTKSLMRLFTDLGWIFGVFTLFMAGFLYEIKKGNASSACMFVGATLLVIKTIETQGELLRKGQ